MIAKAILLFPKIQTYLRVYTFIIVMPSENVARRVSVVMNGYVSNMPGIWKTTFYYNSIFINRNGLMLFTSQSHVIVPCRICFARIILFWIT